MRTTESDNLNLCPQDELFLSVKEIAEIISRWPTPLYLYDEKGLCESAKSLFALFSGISDFRGYFPVSACSKPQVLLILAHVGVGVYCETPEELQLALECGIKGENIIYAPLVLPEEMAVLLRELDAVLLAANPHMLDGILPRRVDLACSIPHKTKYTTMMHNGYRREHLGLTRSQVYTAVPKLTKAGISVGLAMLENLNTTSEKFLASKVQSLLNLAEDVKELTGIEIHRIHPGEGPGYKYKKLDPPMDLQRCAMLVNETVKDRNLTVEINFSRLLVEQQAILLTSVTDIIGNIRPGVVTDASAAMMKVKTADRYRYASIAGKASLEKRVVCDILGCRASMSDWLGERRILPKPEIGDTIVFHDVGCSVASVADGCCFLRRQDGTVVRLEHCEE